MRAVLHNNRDFIQMGQGIEDRYARCAAYWEPHLHATRDFIRRTAGPARRVAVLGAGRLLDIDIYALLERVEEIHLFDADRACKKYWSRVLSRSARKRVVSRIEDVTGCLAEWSTAFKHALREPALTACFDSLAAPIPRWVHEEFDGVISLNIAGQIPIYWRDRVFAKRTELSLHEEEALVRSCERLQVAHLSALRRAASCWAVCITDVEYYSYESDRSHWDVEDALYGAARRLFNAFDSESTKIDRDCWLWHLAPQFIESDNEGGIHRVEARLLQKPLG